MKKKSQQETVSDSVNISEQWFTLVPKDAKLHLLNSLRNLAKLRPPTPSFKLYGKSDWSVVTDFLNSKEVSATHPPKWLLEYELSREDKFGAQGGHAPWAEMRENAEMYWTRPRNCRYTSEPEVLQKYQRLSLLRRTATDTLQHLKGSGKVMTRANGWRLFNLKKTDEAAQRDAIHLIKTGEWRKGWGYFFARYNKKKKRLFIPMPFCTIILQGEYAVSFLESIQADLRLKLHESDFIFWGDKIGFHQLFLKIMTPKLQGYDPNHIVYVARDFEKMDTSVGVSQKQNCYIPKLAAAYHYSRGSANYKEMSDIILFSNRCPVATPEGMWEGDHGEASGSEVTNEGETCCNEDYDFLYEKFLSAACSQHNIKYSRLISVGNGDDGMSVYYLEDVTQFEIFKELIGQCANKAARICGYRVQGEKWSVNLGTYGKYCQYLPAWDPELDRVRMRYPAALILNSIVNPEKQYTPSDWDKDYRDIDIISKLNNGWDLEYFHELIDYVDNGMKFHLLGRDEPEFHRILSKWESYLALQDGSRQFNIINDEWDRDPYSSPVVQYLLDKRHYTRPNRL